MEKEQEKLPPSGEHKIAETYTQDMAEVIGDDTGGLVKKIIQDEEARRKEKMDLATGSIKNKFFVFLSIVFILAGFFAIYMFVFKRTAPVVVVQKQFMPLIFLDKSVSIDVKSLKKDEIASKVLNEVKNTQVKDGGVEGIYLSIDSVPIALRNFVKLIEGNLVLPLPTNNVDLVYDNFLMGVVNSKVSLTLPTSKDLFILLKMRSTQDIFGSMRDWEKKMFLDLHSFLGIDISEQTKYLLTKEFQDGVMENKNARILYDNNNNILLMYVFADDNSIVVTNSNLALHEIVLRLASSQVKQ